MVPSPFSPLHGHFPWHGPPEVLAVAVLAACTAMVLLVLRPVAVSRSELTLPYTPVQQSSVSEPGMAVIHSPTEARVRFSVGGYRGTDLFTGGMPTSRAVDCGTRSLVDGAPRLRAFGRLQFDRDSGIYTYRWAIEEAWRGTCRRLDLAFADGTSHAVLVRFSDPAGWTRSGRCGQPLIEPASIISGARAAADRARSC